MATFHYKPTSVNEEVLSGRGITTDFAKAIVALTMRYHLYHIEIGGDGERALALLVPQTGRVGIAWGGDAEWSVSTGDIERDIDDWLNSRGAWAVESLDGKQAEVNG